ncbi:MAG: hypothetical protein OXF62_13230 [Caldilineaceae bacterium]|nr:hypothetical protein [Caldilineaceae bacterium]MCY4116881.1 hypothetical protein [Caldilineaceae bacterium]
MSNLRDALPSSTHIFEGLDEAEEALAVLYLSIGNKRSLPNFGL